MPKAWRGSQGIIYFLHAPSVKRLKIGFSTDLKHRMRELKMGCPVELKLIKSVKGSMRMEGILLAIFERYRTHGEWFVAHPDLLRFIKTLREGQPLSLESIVK